MAAPVSRRKSLITGTIVITVILGVWIWVFRRQPSMLEVATKFRDCALAADGACVRSYLTSAELRDNPATAEEITDALKRFVVPVIGGTPTPFDTSGIAENGYLNFSCKIQSPSREVGFAVTVAETDEGVKVIDGLSSLVVGAALQKNGKWEQGKKLASIAKVLPEWVPELEGLHINGMRRRPSNEFYNWSDYLALLSAGPPKKPARSVPAE